MASTREERMQQRLRGAQRREVKEVDFGLAFPIAQPSGDPALSPPRSPQLEQPSPEIRPVTQNHNSSKEQTPGVARTQLVKSGNIDANISAKRRKLNTDGEPPSTRSTRSTHAPPRSDVYSLPEDGPQEPPSPGISKAWPPIEATQSAPDPTDEPVSDQPISILRHRTAKTPPLPEAISEEVTESPADAPGSGHRTQIVDSVRAVHLRLQTIQNSSPTNSNLRPLTSPTKRTGRPVTSSSPGPEVSHNQRGQSTPISPIDDEDDEPSPDQPASLLRKRKSIVEDSPGEEEHVTESPNVDEEEAEAIPDLEAASILKKNRRRRIARNTRSTASPDLDKVEAIPQSATKPHRRRKHIDSSPSKQRHPKIPSKSTTKKPKQVAKTDKFRRGSPIPVTVHRFTQQPQYDEDESDADILNSEIPYAKRPGVNVADVLSQICHEIIDTGLETLQNGGRNADDPSLRREYKTKWNALRLFGDQLQTRLLTHTINLDNAYSLEKRVREEHKRKQVLRDEILRIRLERQQVAVRMDEIRIRHEDEAKKAQERDALNAVAHDIELAVDIGKGQAHTTRNGEVEMAGIEALLRRMAHQVSNKGDSGGILKQVKEFNGFLERAASALESRKA